MRKKDSLYIRFHRYISACLILVLFLSQTIQVSWFDRANAGSEDYRDIVSLVIDEDTYGELRTEVRQYAEDIQGYLKATRVSILVTPKDIRPEVIAAYNEKLYYEGDGRSAVSNLVGTVIIGDVPMPIVHKEGISFPSLYPYVDFDDKRFTYDALQGRYLAVDGAPESSNVDIWHGVINPALGRTWDSSVDIPKIRDFLLKTHDFYTQSGRFRPATLPPRVFYYDGYNEGASVDPASLYKYVLFTQNAENIIYKRWSKYLLGDISEALSQFNQANKGPEDAYAATLSGMAGVNIGDESLDPATIAGLPDIQTARPILSFLKKFHEIINTKTLSDIQKAVHNAGRYNSGTLVRVDQGAIAMSMTDEISMQTIQATNQALEDSIDRILTSSGYARPIVILDGVSQETPFVPNTVINATLPNQMVEYKNYFFGKPASTIATPADCSIARGSSGDTSLFGRSILVEANAGYDVNSTQGHVGSLSGDTAELIGLHRNAAYACFSDAGIPKLDSYFGRNSLLRISGTTIDPNSLFTTPPSGTSLTGFSQSIFSLGGMKETTRLPDPSINDCLNPTYQYTLLQPHTYIYNYTDFTAIPRSCTSAYPDEWNRGGSWPCTKQVFSGVTPRFTCLTTHTFGPSGKSLQSALTEYATVSCVRGTITIDGKYYNGASGLGGAPTTFGTRCITYGNPLIPTPDIDRTIYKNHAYHTIPSLMKHVSPTSSELAAAESNGATPSLPIDVVRSVEFLTPRGARAQFTYPNLFDAPSESVASVRAWLKNLSDTEWNAIINTESGRTLSAMEAGMNTALGTRALPTSPLDWNTLISDEAIEKVIRARQWLIPDVTEKYQSLVETSLSYSHLYSGSLLQSPLERPDLSEGYEIAYLGLTPFVPGGEKDPSSEDIQDYQYRIGELQGLNFSERDAALDDPASRATAQCGPPEGVPLFQWPQAIICWMKTLFPPRITAGSCGGNTIGNSQAAPTISPPANIIRDSARLRAYYTQGRLVYQVPRTSFGTYDSLPIIYRLDRDGSSVALPSDAIVRLSTSTLTSAGTAVTSANQSQYVSLSSPEAPYTEKGFQFLLSSYERLASVTLRPVLTIRLPDGSTLDIPGDPLVVNITDEYIDVVPTVDTLPTSTIDVTETRPVTLSLTPRRGASGDTISPDLPYTLDIYDDVSNTLIQSGITLSSASYQIPSRYRNIVGVYRIIATDAGGRTGESTLAVRAGPLASMEFRPVSSTLTTNSTSVGVLRLLDAQGNLISPSLLDLEVSVAGGYIIDADGKRVSTISLDTIESELVVSYGAENIGNMSLTFRTVDPEVTLSSTLRVIENPRIRIVQSAVPQVGGDSIDMHIEIIDTTTNTILTGFSSLASIELPAGAGAFSATEVSIIDGKSADFIFTPGKKAGSQVLSIDIPGIGNAIENRFNILPGVPMYIDGTIGDTTIDFSLRDRYGNLSSESPVGTLAIDRTSTGNIAFTNGVASFPRSPGYWRIDVPTIANNTLTYTDDINTQVGSGVTTQSIPRTIRGIPFYNLYIQDVVGKYNFLPDYNARYTVLAGDSYLREGSQILYDTTPGDSQSLAVSTLLQSPYEKETFFSVFPGGGFTLGQTLDTAIETTLSLRGQTLILSASDSASQTPIARVAYPVQGLSFSSCTESGTESNLCSSPQSTPHITVALLGESDYRAEETPGSISIVDSSVARLTYTPTEGLSLGAGIRLVPRPEYSAGNLVADIEDYDEVIGRIIVSLPESQGIDIGDTSVAVSRVTLDTDHAFSRSDIYARTLSPESRGYSIHRDTDTVLLDERLIGPSHIESFGSLLESPGVGWQGNNRALLSFAAGDSVGEANKWFHSYTLVNLGDPVAHVERGAPDTEVDGIDRSIGTQIAGSTERSISAYKYHDMNNDGLDDIIVIYSDGFIELHMNMGGTFRRKQMIAYIPDMSSRGVEFGDFLGDGYADMISLNNSGSFLLVDNSERRLGEKMITLSSGGLPPTGVGQYRIFDMDADGRDDIVYLTEAGELGILYATTTPGVFDKNILDATLGVSLSADPETAGGAVRASTTPREFLSSRPANPGDPDEIVLNNEIFYERRVDPGSGGAGITIDPLQSQDILLNPLPDPNSASGAETKDLFVRSEYSPAYGLTVEKRYRNVTASTLHGGDRIQVEITLRNTSTNTITGIEYLDTLSRLFQLLPDSTYRATLGTQSIEAPLVYTHADQYSLAMRGFDIPAGQVMTLSYEVEALPTDYGNLIVDTLEGGLAGDDAYGDVGFETSNTCGADMILWSSTDFRIYQRGTRSFSAADMSPELAAKLQDADKNGIPDSIENMSTAELTATYNTLGNQTSMSPRPLVNTNVDASGRVVNVSLSSGAEQDAETIMQNLADGLSCGFGGGGCMSSPINWAPLAPGNAISVMGSPVGRSPAVNQGIPIFSALTRMDIGVTPYCMTIPFIWPVTPLSLGASLPCSSTNVATAWGEAITQLPTAFVGQSTASTTLGAGGVLGTSSSSNFIRIFITPTLTLGLGTAICLGPASTNGPNPLYPLAPKGNCIVMTKSLPVCKGDGSAEDGNVAGVSGLGSMRQSWNANSCTMQAATSTPAQTAAMTQDIISYLRSPQTSRLNTLYANMAKRGSRSVDLGGPVVRMGNSSTPGTTIDIGIDSSKPLNSGEIVKVNNRRISGFPEFIMDWVSRQTDEITNKLLTLPNIVIIPPRSFGQNAVIDGSFDKFLDRFSKSSQEQGIAQFNREIGKAGESTAATNFNKSTTGNTTASRDYNTWLDAQVSKNASTINSVAGGANQIRAAYQFVGQLPFVRIEKASVPINIPWILPQELDRYSRSLKQYQSEITRAGTAWCVGRTPQECADARTSVGLGGLTSGIESSLRRIEEWRRFPEKIQKYVTWKQRYISQILCNVDALEQMIGGWYRDNGVRFKKWAEFYVLMKTIVSTWQPFIDLWKEKDKSCSVCQNQRWDLKYFKFKALSAVIPQIPILQFPRWPDIKIDFSDIRFGILIRVPDFQFNINPIRLPDLPSLGLPGMPSLSISLPGLPTLPALPSLPDLPDLPSLPRISLPNLPPPPKLPKLFGAVSVGLNIFKLYTKIQCYMEKSILIPEDYVGATIAQRTDRQGTLPFDFLSVQFPQIAIPGIREIKISTHINFELKSDFIVEFARSAVKPINKFSTDFAKMPTSLAPNLRIPTPPNITLPPVTDTSEVDDSVVLSFPDIIQKEIATLTSGKDALMDTDTFAGYLRSELVLAGLDATKLDRSLEKARIESDSLTSDMQEHSKKGFALLRQYLKAEEAETKEVEKMIDRMKESPNLLGSGDLPRALLIANPTPLSEDALRQYQDWQGNTQTRLDASLATPVSADRQVTSLQRQVGRLLASTFPTTGSPSATPSDIASGYAPKYEGIYILTPVTDLQTRLFDYTDLLGTENHADIVDIDQDGDDDYIYMLGGSLYVKYAHRMDPIRAVDSDIVTISPDLSLVPRAPDFFHEEVASPGQAQISFAPADALDRSFRLEFFDKYLEWDLTKLTGNDDPLTPRTTIDMTVAADPPNDPSVINTSPVLRSLESVSDPTGFLLEGMKVTTLLSGQEFSLSAGRAIYTGNGQATLTYTDVDTDTLERVTLERFTRYTFPDTLSGSVTSGRAYVLNPAGSERLTYTDDMRGMPLLPGTRIIHTQGTLSIYDPIADISTQFDPGTEYRHLSLGRVSDTYFLNFPFPNGFYSARLRSLTDDRLIHAGVTLLAPQAALDHSSPVIDIPGTLRIPVYQDLTLSLSDVVTDMSPYTITIDTDTTIDSDANGIYDDDSTAGSGGVSLTATGILFGPYDTLGTRKMSAKVVDAYGNMTIEPVEVEVYAPVPTIASVSSSGMLFGGLDKELAREPVSLFRVREGEGIRLVSAVPMTTDLVGAFSLPGLFEATGGTITYLGGSVVLSETTGLPLSSAGLIPTVSSASASGSLRVSYADTSGNPLFTYDIIPPAGLRIASSLAGLAPEDPVLVITPGVGYRSVTASLADPSIPAGVYITSLTSQPLLAIDSHGQVYTLDPSITLTLAEEAGYIHIHALQGSTEVADLWYRVEFFPTAQ